MSIILSEIVKMTRATHAVKEIQEALRQSRASDFLWPWEVSILQTWQELCF
jgi:hypothetical protein